MKNIIITLLTVYLNVLNTFSKKLGGKHAFNVFCYPFKAKLNRDQQSFLYTSHSFKLGIRDFEIQCYRWGSGPKKILFVHGWQSNSFRWKKYIDSLPKNQYTLYCFDAPGHGNSGSRIGNIPLYGEAINNIMKHIGEIDTVIAHSIGSLSTFCYLKLHPENLPSKIVSLAAPASAEDFIQDYFEQLSLSQKTISNFTKHFVQYANHPISFYKVENLFFENYAQGLIIHDKKDKVVSYDCAQRMHNLWPQSKLITTEGYGHKLKDDQVVHLVQSFIEEDIRKNEISGIREPSSVL